MKTQLSDRVLWFDGTSQVNPELVPQLLLAGVPPKLIALDGTNEDVELFNSLADEPLEFGKLKNRPLDITWKIPEKYQVVNIRDELIEDLWVYLNKTGIDESLHEEYTKRLEAEIEEIQLRGMRMIICTLMYIIDTFEKKGIVWGVGRGSSCASLALLVLGLHKVDPIKYGIPMTEFFHD